MTPKEKAQQLIYAFEAFTDRDNELEFAKQCALIAVDEVIKQWEYIDIYIADLGGELNTNLKYWYEVKEEIIKL